MTKVTLIVGANSTSSRLNGLVEYTQKVLFDYKIQTQVIQVHMLPHQALLTADVMDKTLQKYNEQLAASEGVFIFTPIFKGSYSGILKTYLDVLPQKALANKVVYALGLGGSQHHLLALQYALEPVLKELGTEELLQSTYVLQDQVTKEERGFTVNETVRQRINQQLDQVIQRIELKQQGVRRWEKIV
ncbi:NAD(P)H-dependent oxidoreductase [Enterococcus saccharolyticus]|uniref:FMN reductase n=1 Tax=Candidatus Enterococcus willemsii TaxID=1857215 RepID=A0ABQ6YZJ9_9ENTE|nr:MULTISPECIES: NAD(P)H-dependent oxidoreductase [Enterococcus]KAF1304048.1 FMN reductase [Enterococcus sp. CU12B]MCD5002091.1 NAD(P)H-dependent oxidoreductase [Enterococcus saccharolyticus]